MPLLSLLYQFHASLPNKYIHYIKKQYTDPNFFWTVVISFKRYLWKTAEKKTMYIFNYMLYEQLVIH